MKSALQKYFRLTVDPLIRSVDRCAVTTPETSNRNRFDLRYFKFTRNLHDFKLRMDPSRKKESTLDWLAKSMGFVDLVCCYSYSEQQIYSESSNGNVEVDMSSVFVPPSWDMDDTSIGDQHQQSKYFTNHRKIGKPDHNGYPHKGRGTATSPARSIATQSTVTTSTTTTVVTSSRTHNLNTSGDTSLSTSSLSRGQRRSYHDPYRSERNIPTPDQIYCHSHADEVLHESQQLRPVNSRSHPAVPFTLATEGYPC